MGVLVGGGLAIPASFPLSLSPALWLDASDTSTITHSGGAVAEWADKSGQGRHAVQTTTAMKPTTGSNTINGNNVITFDGSDDTMTFASNFMLGSEAGTCCAVWLTSSGAGTGSAAVFGDDYADFGAQMYETFGTSLRQSFTHGITLANANLFSFVSGDGDHRAYINNSLKLTTGTNTVAWSLPLFLSNDPPAGTRWGGQFAEILLFPYALSDTDRVVTQTYLKNKWNTP